MVLFFYHVKHKHDSLYIHGCFSHYGGQNSYKISCLTNNALSPVYSAPFLQLT